MAATKTDEQAWRIAHKARYKAVTQSIGDAIMWRMSEPYLREASVASARFVKIKALAPWALAKVIVDDGEDDNDKNDDDQQDADDEGNKVQEQKDSKRKGADGGEDNARVFTQYNLVVPCAERERAGATRWYADIVVARSNRCFEPQTPADNWAWVYGFTREHGYRMEDAFGTKLDSAHIFGGVCASTASIWDSDGVEYRTILSSGIKTRYAPLEEAKERMRHKEAKRLRDEQQQQDSDEAPDDTEDDE